MRRLRGFTLIELLMVIVIIGILVTVLIPRFTSSRDKAYVAAMKSDLRNLVTAQESYFADNVTYTTDLGTAFSASAGVTVTIGTATGTGWAASAAHNGTTKTCEIAVGGGVATGQNEGEPKCT